MVDVTRKSKMRVHVDPDLCIGCGICEGNAPDVFSLAASAIAEVIMDPVQPDFEEDARSAAEDCPEGAIVIENGEDSETPTPPAADSADDAEEFTNENDLERKFEMKATVDQDLCIGCGICENKCVVVDEPAIRVSSIGEKRSEKNRLLLQVNTQNDSQE